MKTKFISTSDPEYGKKLAKIILDGGIVGAIWGHHLYILACNGLDINAVTKLNKLKERSSNQVCAIAGAIEEIEEFVDLKETKGLMSTAKKVKVAPLEYIELLFRKFPLLIEFAHNERAPKSAVAINERGNSVWIGGHLGDKFYTNLITEARNLRSEGEPIVIVGSSLNLHGDSTLTVRDLEKTIKDFGNKIDALAVHHRADQLKRLSFSLSSSVISFLTVTPTLLRIGSTRFDTLRKYIPDLKLAENVVRIKRTV